MSIFKRRATTENYKEFRRVFGQIRKISTQGTMQEVDMTAAYLFGVVVERAAAGRLTRSQREALLEMIEAKQEERRGELEAEDGEEEYFGELPPYKVGS